MNIEKFGLFLQSQRKSKGMTQGELAQKLHVTDKAVSRWERGIGFPDIKLLEPLAAALDLSVAELLQCERTVPKVVEEPTAVPKEQLLIFVDEGNRRTKYKQGLAVCRVVTIALVAILAYYVGRVPDPWWLYPVALILIWVSRLFVERLLRKTFHPEICRRQPVSYHVMFAVYAAGIMKAVFERTIESRFNQFAAEQWDILGSVLLLVGLVGMLFTDNQLDRFDR